MLLKPTTGTENWEEYCSRNFQYTDPIGFIRGTQETVTHVESLLEKTNNYEELKNELLTYINEREVFLKQATDVYASGKFKRNNSHKI